MLIDVLGAEKMLYMIDLFLDIVLLIILVKCFKYIRFKGRLVVYLLLISIILSFVFNLTNPITLVNGLREIIILPVGLSVMHMVFLLNKTDYFLKFVKVFILFFLIIQIPTSILQYLEYGSGDFVGGSLSKGNSGVLTLSIFIFIFTLVNYDYAYRNRNKLSALIMYSPLFIPVILNETKITFVILPIFLISLFEIKNMKSILLVGLLVSITISIFAFFYYSESQKTNNPIEDVFSKDFLKDYLAGDVGSYEDVPRLTKIQMALFLLKDNLGNFFFGYEYGAFKGGSYIGKSDFAMQYEWLLTGSRPYLFYLLISGGVSLFFIFLSLIKQLIYFQYGTIKLNKFQKLFFISIISIILFYNDSFRDRCFGMALTAMVISLITINKNKAIVNDQ